MVRNLAFASVAVLAAALLPGCPAALGTGVLPGPGAVQGEHWLRFAQISDTQLADEESPARGTRTDGLIAAAWRPQETYGVATLDATLRVINARNAEGKDVGRPVNFVVVTGDLCDSAEYNELRWFIDTMDGTVIDTDTGMPDAAGRTPDDADNGKLPYAAEGLSRDIPWYTVIGNHDALAVGNFPVDTSSNSPTFYSAPLLGPVAAVIGLHQIDHGLNAFYPVAGKSPAVITGQGPLINADTLQIDASALHAGKIVADTSRRFLSLDDFIAEHFNSDSLPEGHGFTPDNVDARHAYYTFRPDPNVPVRFIAMDTVPSRAPNGYPAFYGVMTREQFDGFVKPEIEKAKAAHEFVILLSHHPSSDFSLPFPEKKLNADEFRGYLSSQPNVIAHLCGHTHVNRIHRVDGTYPYFEVETGAIIDYPQEARMYDVFYDAASGTVTLAAEMFGHMESPTRLSAESYRRCYIDALQGQSDQKPPDEKYQAMFKDVSKAWGLGQPVPREDWKHSADERRGGELDRDVTMSLPRPPMESWK